MNHLSYSQRLKNLDFYSNITTDELAYHLSVAPWDLYRSLTNMEPRGAYQVKEPVQAAAKDYEEKIRAKFPDSDWPQFDLLLLGMGPDGHTASLFPGHPLLDEQSVWVAAIADSPKPPPCRVTMTFPVINKARCCAFAMAGEGKADMVKRILGDGEELPSGMVQPTGGELLWILDKSAASKL
ncbi:6-phosphogluconolactonase [Portunus trituberculatus]|uniref:6-phosphogluconolactonase n=1 Tax=Portunus trituberculatus TaxID=210409 RepID=A0A5B7DRF2_PORTR|nr:6-phosphogluconolactonase [Portunus trituberculatus]